MVIAAFNRSSCSRRNRVARRHGYIALSVNGRSAASFNRCCSNHVGVRGRTVWRRWIPPGPVRAAAKTKEPRPSSAALYDRVTTPQAFVGAPISMLWW